MSLFGKQINLRALEPEDLSFLFSVENNDKFWEISHTQAPFSKFLLKKYLENAHLDIYQIKQLRLLIEEKQTKTPVGLIDLFNFNPQHKRAGVGIVILEEFQQKGYANEALKLLINYSFSYLQLHQLYANITSDNTKSIALFKKHNFIQVGIKKDWIFTKDKYKNEILYQLINE